MRKILVVEDDAMTLQLINYKLRQSGFTIIPARDGESALKLLTTERPEVILLDAMMPVMDGFEVLEKIKQDPDLKSIPVIMLTARTQDSDIARGKELGASDYILKPFSPTDLLQRVKAVLASNPAAPTV